MSMGSKRPGWKTVRNRFNRASREFAQLAERERCVNKYEPALRLCLLEIEQFHSTAYPKCEGGCPAHQAIAEARKALGMTPNEDLPCLDFNGNPVKKSKI